MPFIKLPANVWILAITGSLALTGVSLTLFVGSLIGRQLAPSADLATLPIAAFVVGTALGTIPAAMLLKHFGRKLGTYFGLTASLTSAAAAVIAVNIQSFGWLVASGVCLGIGVAFYQQFRFAALESLPTPNLAGPALSILMLFNIFGALAGPEIGERGRSLMAGTAPYTGSFAIYAGMILVAMLVFASFRNPVIEREDNPQSARPLSRIICQPRFLIALAAAAIGYGVMSFIMTSTPLSMHEQQGFNLTETKQVLQSHLLAMFLPSLFSGLLLQRFGAGRIMLAGGVLYFVVIAIAMAGQHYLHYWWALVLLGIGWNFLFLSGTSILPESYHPAERFKAQAANDFSIFTLQALASLSAAWVLFNFGWKVQALITLPLTLIVVGAALLYMWLNRSARVNPPAGIRGVAQTD